jgi:predicted transcriptional regulator
MKEERRNIRERSAMVQYVIKSVIDNPSVTLTVETLHQWLNVPLAGAERILAKLVASGLVREVHQGV